MVSCDVACHVTPARINTRTYDRSLASVPISTFRYEDTTRCAIKSLVRCGGGHFQKGSFNTRCSSLVCCWVFANHCQVAHFDLCQLPDLANVPIKKSKRIQFRFNDFKKT